METRFVQNTDPCPCAGEVSRDSWDSRKLEDELNRVVPLPEKETQDAQLPISSFRLASEKSVKKGSGIIVDGESGCSVKYAKCCSPLP